MTNKGSFFLPFTIGSTCSLEVKNNHRASIDKGIRQIRCSDGRFIRSPNFLIGYKSFASSRYLSRSTNLCPNSCLTSQPFCQSILILYKFVKKGFAASLGKCSRVSKLTTASTLSRSAKVDRLRRLYTREFLYATYSMG